MTNKVGRPTGEPTCVIKVPVDKLKLVERLLKRKITLRQKSTVNVRVPVGMVETIKQQLKG